MRRPEGVGHVRWHSYLASKQRSLAALIAEIASTRAAVVAEMYAEPGASYATVALRLGLSRAKVQQLVERARREAGIVTAPRASGAQHPSEAL